jgi:hypothetical protein
VEVVSLLLAAGAPLEARDPLDNACCEGHVGVVSVLLPAEFASADNKTILAYLRELKSSSTSEIYRMRIMIVGPGNVGKTTLVQRLLHDNFDPVAAGATLEATDEVMYEFVWSGRRECLTVCRMDGLLSTILVGMGKSNWLQCCWRQVQLLRQEIRYESGMSWSGLVKESV